MKKYIKLLRLKHWIKNGLIFLPLVCSYSLSNQNIMTTLLAFLSFSFMASFVYIMNDIRDIEKDRNHPRKKKRPIASGEISIRKAQIISVLMLIISIAFNYLATGSLFNVPLGVLLMYLANNICYSFGMKNIPIIDVLLLTAGFILRIYYGASIIKVQVSSWLFLTVLTAALYLGLGKRRKEFNNSDEVRPVLKYYNKRFIDNFMNISLTLVIVFYSFWTMEQTSTLLYFSIPILIVIFMQYMLFMETSNEGDPVTLLFQHKPLLLTTVFYILYMLGVMIVVPML